MNVYVDGDLVSGGSGGLPSGPNGSILIRVAGAWVPLSIGTNGYLLTCVAGLPAWAPPPTLTDVAYTNVAQLFDGLQTLNVTDASGSNPTVSSASRHTSTGGIGSWCGVAHALEVSDGGTTLRIGVVRARLHSGTSGSFVELAPYEGGTITSCGLRCRAVAASCVSAVEVIMAAAGGVPTIQPCQETPPANLGMLIRAIGNGLVATERLGLHAGTVTDILNGTGLFADPQETQLALATNGNGGGGALAVYVNAAWMMAPLVPLA